MDKPNGLVFIPAKFVDFIHQTKRTYGPDLAGIVLSGSLVDMVMAAHYRNKLPNGFVEVHRHKKRKDKVVTFFDGVPIWSSENLKTEHGALFVLNGGKK